MYQHLPQKVIQYVCHFAGLIVLTYTQFQSIIGVIIAMTEHETTKQLEAKVLYSNPERGSTGTVWSS